MSEIVDVPRVARHTLFDDAQALLTGTLFVAIGLALFRHAGLMTGGGFYPTGTDQVSRLRAAIDSPRSGQDLQRITDALVGQGFELGGERVATRPRGVAADHPRLPLMRFKSLVAKRVHGAPPWLSTPVVVEHVRRDWRAVRPLVDWLTEHVGATEQPRGR